MTAKPLPHQWLSGADTPNSLAQQVQENFDALAQVSDEPVAGPWLVLGIAPAPGFENSWGDYGGAGALTPRFYKNRVGTVRMRGNAAGGNLSLRVFTLPVGYRPASANVYFPARFYNGTSVVIGAIVVDPTGGVFVDSVNATNAYISFDAVAFRAEA